MLCVGSSGRLQDMPVALRELPRSAPQILHEFDLALNAGDLEASRARLRELERQRAVESLNLRYLTIRWHAAFRQWRGLREERWFSDVCKARRPPQVTIALLCALFETDLGGGSRTENVESLLARFRTHISPEAGSLFRQPLPSPPGPAAVMLALDAVSRGDSLRIAELSKVSTEGWESHMSSAFRELLTVGSPSTSAAAETEQSPVDSILELARNHSVGRPLDNTQRIALRQILEQEHVSLDVYEVVRTLIGDPTVPVDVDTPEADPSKAIGHQYQEWTADNWSRWFAALPHLEFRTARDLAQRIAEETCIEEYVKTAADRDRLVRELEEALSSDEQHATLALPHLARWTINDGDWPRQEFGPLYRALLTAFLLFDTRTVDGFRSSLAILEGWLSIGPDEYSYGEVLGDYRRVLGDLAARRSIDALIDLAEMLVTHPAPNAGARVALWSELQARLLSFRTWMNASQILILNGLCDVIEVPRAFVLDEKGKYAADPIGDWSGTIGLYTLRPSIGQRVVHVLEQRIPGAKVHWRDDHAASNALRQLTESSDIIALDWSAAKHAATDAIRKDLGQRDPLWVSGGASSMVTSILETIRASQQG